MVSKLRILVLILILVGGASATVVGLSYYFHSPTCSLANSAATARFTIIESNLGFNESKNHPAPWPVITVHCYQIVTIHVFNNDTAEPHGFEIDHYLTGEIVLRPGLLHDVIFNATLPGSFRFFCTIPCIVHPYMLSGQLIVTR